MLLDTQLDPANQQPSNEPPISTNEAQAIAPEAEVGRAFKKLREQAQQALREKQQAETEREELRRQLQQATSAYDIAEDPVLDGRELKKYDAVRVERERKLQEELEKTRQEVEEIKKAATEQYLQGKFKDFDSVVNEDNLDKLAALKPAAYRSIFTNPDMRDRGELAYDLITQFNIVKRDSDIDRKIEENRNKPRSSASAPSQTGDTPLTRLGDYERRILTQEQKDANMRRLAEIKKLR